MKNTIVLISSGRVAEAVAAGVVRPGHFVELTSAGKAQVQSQAGEVGRKLIAYEDALQGKTIREHSYAVDDVVFMQYLQSGDIVQARLKIGENITQGDKLTFDGAGALEAWTAGAGDANDPFLVAFAAESVDNSGGSEAVLIKVEIA